MTTPIQPQTIDPNQWHLQKKPEEWQAILTQAIHDHQINPDDTEAAQAVKDATEALNAYEQPAIAAGENVGASGFGKVGPALEGLGQAAADIPSGLWSVAKGLVTHPTQVPGQLLQGLAQIPKGLASGDPEQIARSVGNVGSFFLPGAEFKAGGPTVGALARGAVEAPFRAAGAALSLPAEKLRLAEAQRAASEGSEARAQELHPAQVERAQLGAEQSRLKLQTALSRLREEVAGPPTTPPQGFEPTSNPSSPFGNQPQGGTVAPKGTISDIPGTAGKGLQVTGEAPPMGAAAPKPTLADMTGMSNLQYEPGEITQAQTPVQQLMESLNIEQSPEVGDLTWKRPRGIQPSFPDIGKFRKGQAPEAPTALPEQGLAEALNPESEMAQNAMANLLKKLGSARRGL